jgi:phosphoserine phosphatase RsbU/P
LAAVIAERRRIEDADRYIAETLQTALLPPGLPNIPGIEAAVEFRPAGMRELVGGDVYDWFESAPGSWDAFVGDVRGKGAPAGRATALARYRLRANAVHDGRPNGILRRLNDAVLRQHRARPARSSTSGSRSTARGRSRNVGDGRASTPWS